MSWQGLVVACLTAAVVIFYAFEFHQEIKIHRRVQKIRRYFDCIDKNDMIEKVLQESHPSSYNNVYVYVLSRIRYMCECIHMDMIIAGNKCSVSDVHCTVRDLLRYTKYIYIEEQFYDYYYAHYKENIDDIDDECENNITDLEIFAQEALFDLSDVIDDFNL